MSGYGSNVFFSHSSRDIHWRILTLTLLLVIGSRGFGLRGCLLTISFNCIKPNRPQNELLFPFLHLIHTHCGFATNPALVNLPVAGLVLLNVPPFQFPILKHFSEHLTAV